MSFIRSQSAFAKLGKFLSNYLEKNYSEDLSIKLADYHEFEQQCQKAFQSNPWFIEENIEFALRQWAQILNQKNIEKWLSEYQEVSRDEKPLIVGVVLAGNLPLVGFHDFLSVMVSGNHFLGKLSSSDKYLLPAIAQILTKIESKFEGRIQFTEGQLSNFDAIIATGSNNSARYFESYFGKYPHIIRKNRNGVAVLTGSEKNLNLLTEDILRYFGLGCRNVSKLYVPDNYDFIRFLESMKDFEFVANHHKYCNNYDYNKSILLVNRVQHLDNGIVLLKEDSSISSPISVINYEHYQDLNQLKEQLASQGDLIQCIVSEEDMGDKTVLLGQSQSPNLWDYADGVDTLDFLLSLRTKK
jgi:hypothetical protein